MSIRIHTAYAKSVAMSVLDPERLADMYGFDEPTDEQALVIEDAGNCEALALLGSDDDLEQFALDILARIKRTPMVLVIEAPNEDPDVYTNGPIEVMQASVYPATRYASNDVESGGYDGFVESTRERARNLDEAGAPHLGDQLRSIADLFEVEHADYLAQKETD